MEIKGNTTSFNGNQDFKAVKNLFDENAKLSSKNIISTTAPACWEGKFYTVKVEAENGTPVTFCFDVPNKPLESGTPETAWYVPEEQLDEMLNTNLNDLIKEDKFERVFVDKDNDGNPELTFGFTSDLTSRQVFGNRVTIDKNSNGVNEYNVLFDFVEAEDGTYDIAITSEEIDKDEDGILETYNKYNDKGGLKIQEQYNKDGKLTSFEEWNNENNLVYKISDDDNDGNFDNWNEWDDNGELTYQLKYENNGQGGWIEKETGDKIFPSCLIDEGIMWATGDDGIKRPVMRRSSENINENIVKSEHDTDCDGKIDYVYDYSWKQNGSKATRKTSIDTDNDGRAEMYEKLVIKQKKDSTTKSYTVRVSLKEQIREFFEGLSK